MINQKIKNKYFRVEVDRATTFVEHPIRSRSQQTLLVCSNSIGTQVVESGSATEFVVDVVLQLVHLVQELLHTSTEGVTTFWNSCLQGEGVGWCP